MIVIQNEAFFLQSREQPFVHNRSNIQSTVPSLKTGNNSLIQLLQPLAIHDDDCYSLASTEFSSLSSIYSPEDEIDTTRRVTFSEDNEVYFVTPIYPKESLSEHFYSYEETQRFRQEYRLERKLLANLGADESSYEGELQDIFETKDLRKHQISHVVVMHNDKIETFCDSKPKDQRKEIDIMFDSDSFWSGSMTWY